MGKKPKKHSRWVVTVESVDHYDYEVIAETKDEAEEKVMKQVQEMNANMIGTSNRVFEVVSSEAVS